LNILLELPAFYVQYWSEEKRIPILFDKL